jgi:uncharacterized protein (UPF0332 family)
MRGIPDKKSIIKLRIEKAYKTKEGIDFLIKRGYLSFAMDRIYYAGFYVVNALALSDGKHFSKHHQLIGYFNKEYLKNNIIDRTIGSILNDTFERRNTIDYDDFATVTKSEVKKYYIDMKKFVKLVNKVIELKN